ncbi:MAG: hypothetical protein WDN06_06850 [Asticcacaulis sp.]
MRLGGIFVGRQRDEAGAVFFLGKTWTGDAGGNGESVQQPLEMHPTPRNVFLKSLQY